MADIVFYGKMGAGKSTAAEYLVREHNYKQMPIAQALKECAAIIWGNDAMTSRDKLQKLGVKVREIDVDAWINNYLEEIDPGTVDDPLPVVNDDCRFPNEYWKLKERGFIFVRVVSQESKRVDRLLRNGKLDDTSQLNHESEGQLMGPEAVAEGITDDYTIFNNGEHDELYRQIEDVLLDIEEQE